MQILNKTVNMRNDVCYKITSQSKIGNVNKNFVERIMAISDELYRGGKSVANIDDFSMANVKNLVRVKKLNNEQILKKQAGFALVGSVTIVGTLVMGILIFVAIRALILG